MRRYSEAVQADVRTQMSPPHRQRVVQISAKLEIYVVILCNWRKAWRLQGVVVPGIPACQRQASAQLERAEGARKAPRPGPEVDLAPQAGVQAEREGTSGGGSAVDRRKKIQVFWGEDEDD
jgi:hypothetical protein